LGAFALVFFGTWASIKRLAIQPPVLSNGNTQNGNIYESRNIIRRTDPAVLYQHPAENNQYLVLGRIKPMNSLKKRPAAYIGISALFIVVVFVYFLSGNGWNTNNSDGVFAKIANRIFHSGNSSEKNAIHQASQLIHQKGPKDPRIASGGIGGIYRPQLTKEQFEKYLVLRQRKPEALIMGILLLDRWDLFDELKTHPECPEACIVIACKSRSNSERLIWAEKLVTLQPGSGLGHFLQAQALLRLNRPADARESLLMGLECHDAPQDSSAFSKEFDNLESVTTRQSVNLDFMMMGPAVWGGMISYDCFSPLIEEKKLFEIVSNDATSTFDSGAAGKFLGMADQRFTVKSDGVDALHFYGSARQLFKGVNSTGGDGQETSLLKKIQG
jgi:hypothetical protein